MPEQTPEEIARQCEKSYLDREGLYPQGLRWKMLWSEVAAAIQAEREDSARLLEVLARLKEAAYRGGRHRCEHKPLRHPLCSSCQLDARIEEASAVIEAQLVSIAKENAAARAKQETPSSK